MSEQTVTVETTQIETGSVTFCDCCGDPVGELDDREHETLVLNPQVERYAHTTEDIQEVVIGIVRQSDAAEIIPIHQTGYTEPVGYEIHGLHRELDALHEIVENAHYMTDDNELDVCHRCLSDRLGGPDVSALETLELHDEAEEENAWISVTVKGAPIVAAGLSILLLFFFADLRMLAMPTALAIIGIGLMVDMIVRW